MSAFPYQFFWLEIQDHVDDYIKSLEANDAGRVSVIYSPGFYSRHDFPSELTGRITRLLTEQSKGIKMIVVGNFIDRGLVRVKECVPEDQRSKVVILSNDPLPGEIIAKYRKIGVSHFALRTYQFEKSDDPTPSFITLFRHFARTGEIQSEASVN